MDWMASFAPVATPLALAANRLERLPASDTAWLVRAGSVDLFLVRAEDGEPVGARQHVAHADAGQLLLGMDLGTLAGDWALIASGAPGTEVLAVPFARLLAALDDERLAAPVTAAIDRWLTRLGESLLPEFPPVDVTPLLDAGAVALADGAIAVSRRATVLITVESGRIDLIDLDNAEVGIQVATGPTLLPAHLWVTARGVTRFTVETDLQRCLRAHPAAIACLQRRLLLGVYAQQRKEAERERERLTLRQQSEAQRTAESLQRLANATRRDVIDAPAGAASVDPLLRACQLLGEAQGMPIKAPAAYLARQLSDPFSDICRASHVRFRRVALRGDWWLHDNGPLLGYHSDDGRPLALLQTPSGRRYRLVDPTTGAEQPVTARNAGAVQPFAYSLYRPFGPTSLDLLGLMRFALFRRGRDVVTIALLGGLVGLLGLVTPWATGQLIDTVIPSADMAQLGQLALLLVAVALSAAMFELTQSFAQLRLEGKLDATTQSAVWDRLLNLPTGFFKQYSAGDLATRAMGISAIRQALSGSTLSTILSSVFSVFSLALMLYYSVTLSMVAIGLVVLAIVITVSSSLASLRHERKLATIEGEISGLTLQMLFGVSKLRAAGGERRAFGLWADAFARQQNARYRASWLQGITGVAQEVYPLFGSIAIFMTLALFMSPGAISTGQFLAFNAAFGTFMGAMLTLSGTAVGLLGIIPLYERAKPILQGVPEISDAKADPGELNGEIEISNLSFAYRPDQAPIINDLTLSIRPGEFLAVVGPSGCGKSTLLRLLLGFETPDAGSISYSGHDLGSLDLGAVRRQLGVVLQKGDLMDGDIFTNIVGSKPLTLQDAEEAARMSGLENDLKSMPMGMHTVVGDGGGTLSGGQRQRLLIARAIVHKPRILFFDEATSALDNQTQATVSASLEQLQATRIVIAHRLSTVVNADRILVLRNGRAEEIGTYEELMANNGLFADMARRQVV